MLELKKPQAIAHPMPFTQRSEMEAERRVVLRDYWGAIRKHWWLVCGLTVLVTAITTVYLVRKPNVYDAQALVMVDLEELNPAQGAASKNPVIVNSAVNDPAYFNTQLRILTSQRLLRRVVKTLDLEHNTIFPRPTALSGREDWWERFKKLFGAKGVEKGKADAKAVATVQAPLNNDASPVNSTADTEEAKRLAPFIKDISDDLRIEPVVDGAACAFLDRSQTPHKLPEKSPSLLFAAFFGAIDESRVDVY
mgnify:CR=1 FL=1